MLQQTLSESEFFKSLEIVQEKELNFLDALKSSLPRPLDSVSVKNVELLEKYFKSE